MPDNLDTLRQRLVDLSDNAAQISNTASGEGRMMTAEEGAQVDAILAEIDVVNEEISRRERINASLNALSQPTGRKTTPAGQQTVTISSGASIGAVTPRVSLDPKRGFKNLGDFAIAGYKWSMGDEKAGTRLRNAGQMESTGEAGGLAVPPDFRSNIAQKVQGPDSLLARCDQMPTSSNNLRVPKDESTPWDTGTGQIQAYWTGESREIIQSQQDISSLSVDLDKLTALVRISDELLEDAPAMSAFLDTKMGDRFVNKLNHSILYGTGAGMMLGISNSPFMVTAPKSATTTATIPLKYEDVLSMWNRVYAPYRNGAVWLIHHELETSLWGMQFKDTAAGETPIPVYLPAGQASATPYATLMGRPVIPFPIMEAPSDPGDIICADFGQYLAAVKGGMRTDVSMHFYFNTGDQAIRAVMRIGGLPWWSKPITPKTGTLEMSAFVRLENRT